MKDKLFANTTAKKVYRRNMFGRVCFIIFLFLLLFLSTLYCVLYVVNQKGNFTITLDPNLSANKHIVMSATSDFKETPLRLEATALDYMDNITESWLPLNIATDYEGEHNGNNYMAYTFFVKNIGTETTNYVMSLDILSVIKNVDDAIRIIMYTNDEPKEVYAKKSARTGETEEGTIPFPSNTEAFVKQRKNIIPNEVDKYTIVIFMEGNDFECVDAILGGEMKMVLSLAEDK